MEAVHSFASWRYVGAAVLLGLTACGNTNGNVSVELGFSPLEMAKDASFVELSVVDTCDGVSFGHSVPSTDTWVIDHSSGGSSHNLSSGAHALYARAIDASCRVIAAGCVPFEVHADETALVALMLTPQGLDPTAQNECVTGYSCGGACGDGADGGVQDDASVPTDGAMPPPCEEDDTCDHATWCTEAPASILLCDGFENPSLPGWTQGVGTDITPVAASSEEAFRGTYSALGSSEPNPASGLSASFLKRSFAPQTTDTVYFRAHFFIAGTADRKANFDLVKLTNEGEEDFQALTLFVANNPAGEPELRMWSGPANQSYAGEPLAVPLDEWFCVRWAVPHVPDETHAAQWWVNDAGQSWPDANTRLTGGIGKLMVPAPLAVADAGRSSVYVDEVAVATTPLGCL